MIVLKVAFFEMYVLEGPVNFDVNRITYGMRAAGAGYCLKMKLCAGNRFQQHTPSCCLQDFRHAGPIFH